MLENIRQTLVAELECQLLGNHPKDIIIVVHDQLDYIRKCLDSLYQCTTNFTLYLWDNASAEATATYLKEMAAKHDNIILERSNDNLGFIIPNNRLAARGTAPYLILLNSDTEVYEGWDTALIGWLVDHPKCAQTGYLGGYIDSEGFGGKTWYGEDTDYICGWCCCLPRHVYSEIGLFDEKNLVFAYGEDADLSFRLRETGYDIYALHLDLVTHHGNATIKEVAKERDVRSTFQQNHLYMKKRWGGNFR